MNQQANSLRPNQAAHYLGVSRATLFRWLKERPDFTPRPRKLGPRVTVFLVSELDAFIDAQQEQ